MRGIVARTLIIAAGIWLAARLIPGIQVDSGGTLILAAIVMGLVNAFVRPIIIILTLPLTLLTLGLFLIVINAAMFGLAAFMLDGFHVESATAALLGWLCLVFVSWVAGWFIGPKGRYEVVIIERR